MENIIHLLIVGVYFGAIQAVDEPLHKGIATFSNICDGHTDGQLVPHPLDCSAYFSCGLLATLFYCDKGLKFDVVLLACNVPHKTQCGLIANKSSDTTSMPNGNLDTLIDSTFSSDYELWTHKYPAFVAVDVTTGELVSPMEKYDPEHIECRHFGAYFLPHPKNCQLYFICTYGHLHRHQCGIGTHWNYKTSECQLIRNADCYNNVNTQESLNALESNKQTTTTPSIQVTVCYTIYDSNTFASDRNQTTNVTISPHPALTCPSERQSYLPHPENCSQYYICIFGMPVLTSCPNGLLWDQNSGYCDQAKNVKCFQNK